MKSALIHQQNGLRTFVVVLATGDDPAALLRSFAAEQQLGGSQFTAIGAFSRAVIAYFDWPSRQYKHMRIDEQVATAHGGHLIEASVRPTLEIVVTELPRHLHRRFDPESGLALIDLTAER